jgi:hypothetical protein
MHEHKHEHELKYCEKCVVVYCTKCNKEWKHEPYSYIYTTPGTTVSPWKTYKGTIGDPQITWTYYASHTGGTHVD